MDSTEDQAHKYLAHLGLTVEYEPDGNQPPDFRTTDGTAIEVRRLNKHHTRMSEPVALEHDTFPLLNGMRSLLAEFGAPRSEKSWFVSYHYSRPVLRWKEIAPAVRRELAFIDQSGEAPAGLIPVLSRFSIQLIRASGALRQRFELGGYADLDSGGWLLADLQSNIQICIDEKTEKIARVRHKYARWWLILVDHIGLGGSSLESESFSEHVRVSHDWDRVILLSPRDHTRAMQVESRGPAA